MRNEGSKQKPPPRPPDSGDLSDSSGNQALDEALAFIETIPDRLGVVGEGKSQSSRQASRADAATQRAFIQSMAINHKLIEQLQTLNEKRGCYGLVYCILPTVVDINCDYGKLPSGSRVKIIADDGEAGLVGKIGYITSSQPDENGLVTVVFDDGSFFDFLAVPHGPDEKREIELVPGGKKVVIVFEGHLFEFPHPESPDLIAGSVVKLSDDGKRLLGPVDFSDFSGDVATITNLTGAMAEVDLRDTTRMVSTGSLTATLKAGNRVVVDPSGFMIVRDLGRPSFVRTGFVPEKTWDDVAGQDEAQAELHDALLAPVDEAALMARFDERPIQGILLIGPPGCGKTLVIEAAAQEYLSRQAEEYRARALFWMNGTDFYQSLVGKGEGMITLMRTAGDDFFRETGIRPLYVIDECDAFKKRGTGISSDHTDSLVEALLKAMQESKGIWLLATNRPDMLDPAMVRGQRIDRVVNVCRPNQAAAEQIFAVHLRKKPREAGVTLAALSQAVTAEIFSDQYGLYLINLKSADNTTRQMTFGLQHILSGAMIEGVVQLATKTARTRQKSAHGRDEFVTEADLKAAVQSVFDKQCLLDNTDAAREWRETLTDQVVGVEKLHQGRQ